MTFFMIYSVLHIIFIIMMGSSSATFSNNKENIGKYLSASYNNFTKDLYKELTSTNVGNIINSPLIIHMILSHLSHGAESTTLDELTKSLYHYNKSLIEEEYRSLIIKLNELSMVKLYIANAMYIQDGFEILTEFLTVGKDVYQSEISKVDFKNNVEASQKINAWVNEKTNNKIPYFVSSDNFNENTKLILINAIYFNGTWLNIFNIRDTKDRIFHVLKNQTKLVPTMYSKSKYTYGDMPTLQAKFIEIPYKNPDVAMIIILPNQIDGLLNLQTNFSFEMLANTTRFYNDIELYLPKFKIEFTMDLKNALNKLGLITMFKPNANFNRISNIPLMVDKVLHKAIIDINEEGTEAAATTGVFLRLRRCTYPEETEKFIVDRPFMFIIEYKPNNIPLFIGNVQDIEVTSQRDEL
ncbi:leukocyte elastase inhibitor [Apis cerana]|uniref:Alaserpin n=1 Tax=Apis cerana cerana TaxID=94128 RepID=A0A2A3E0X3_APICC|nr:leukocyte elastase inhibitor [Apis cerana]PBC25413.1 Alaserpin [Apis cerana cerana]